MAGAPEGNQNALKYDTPRKRKLLLNKYLKHCEQGYPDSMLEPCDIKTFKEYAKNFPIDFPPDQIHEAQMKRAKLIYDIGLRGAAGVPVTYTDPNTKLKVTGKNFNAKSWQFIMMNILGWKNRNDVTTKDAELPAGGGFVIYRPEKLPDNYDEQMKTPGVAHATTAVGTTAPVPPAA